MRNGTKEMKRAFPLAAMVITAVLASGCGGGETASPSNGSGEAASASTRVLPVAKNPISNTSTAAGLTITKALVENNVSATTGKAVDDHLEVALKNTSAKSLDQIGVYYRISDPKKGTSEGYYTKLDGFAIKPGASRVVHFDETGANNHYPVNKYSLYYTDKHALVVDVMASSPGAKPSTFTVKKDAAGAEAGVE